MNSNYTTDRKSTEELKQQVLQDIKKVKDDFEEIKQRMTPGQLIDDAIFYRSGRSPAATFDHLKTNPVGTTFLTLGTLLLMENENHQSYESMARDKAHVVTDKFGNVVHSAQTKMHNVQDKIHSVQDKIARVGDKLQSAGTRVNDVKENIVHKFSSDNLDENTVGFGEGLDVGDYESTSVRSKMQDAKATVGSKLSDVKENAQESIREGMSTARSKISSASDVVKNRAHDAIESAKHLDPLTYLALGAGLGTITGAALPVSEAESELVDTKFESSLSNFSQELQEALNESINILKNEFIGGFTEINMNLF